jgi:uncharacterized membrane protein
LLASFYLYAGGMKLLCSREELRPMMSWVDTTPMLAVRAIGALEVLGALGLLLPPPTRVAPWLSPAAAAGFVLLQIGATRVHLRRGDRRIELNAALLFTAAVVVWLSTIWL